MKLLKEMGLVLSLLVMISAGCGAPTRASSSATATPTPLPVWTPLPATMPASSEVPTPQATHWTDAHEDLFWCTTHEPLQPPKPFWNPKILVDIREISLRPIRPTFTYWPGNACAIEWRVYPDPGLTSEHFLKGELNIRGDDLQLRVEFALTQGVPSYRVRMQNQEGGIRRVLEDAPYPVLALQDGAAVLRIPCLWLPPARRSSLTWRIQLMVPGEKGRALVCDEVAGELAPKKETYWTGQEDLILPDRADDVIDVETGQLITPLPTWADVRGLRLRVHGGVLEVTLLPEQYPPPPNRIRWSGVLRVLTGFLRRGEPIRMWLCGRTLSGSAGYLDPKTLRVHPQPWVQFTSDINGPKCRFRFDVPLQGCFAVSALYLVHDLVQNAQHQDTVPLQPVCFYR